MRKPAGIPKLVEMHGPVGVRELAEMCDPVDAGNSQMDLGSTLVCSTFV